MLNLSLETTSDFLYTSAGNHLSVAVIDSAGLLCGQHIGAAALVNTAFVGIVPGALIYHKDPGHDALGYLCAGYCSAPVVENLVSVAVTDPPALCVFGIDPHLSQTITVIAGLQRIYPKALTIIGRISCCIELVQFPQIWIVDMGGVSTVAVVWC